ncbi:MAG: Processing protease [Candidatus Giovannonibacteria bacterium GW2011_GWA2_53_7]|uniref:Processing protease n=1 Tax=Candidatus Giovannonibacteria bacterium GW2011_GWA2_53_7 TaxID=1618650 RepID=A0A0G1Y189_9BACT|nr:MAG: Processing protease [Candidatus Giovannonibacteria bacterium GW2011_GWA2_53_7]
MNCSYLKNNIPTYLLPSSGTDAVTVLVLVKVGSRYEEEAINGASHFIEHMMFKGTKKRPNAQMISRALDAVGADYNAYTGKDLTGYWVKVDKRHVNLAVDLLHDMIANSTFKSAELNRERQVIMEEINMYHDNPMMHVDEMFESLMLDGSTLGWEIAGDHKRMKEMTRKDVLAFRDAYYTPERMTIAMAGAVPKDAKQQLEATFGTLKSGKGSAKEFVPFGGPRARRGIRAVIQHKDTQQVQLAMGFPSVGYADKDLPAVKLLSVILGGPMSSRLFTSIRERRGLCYFIRASLSTYEDTGLFVVQSGLDKSRLGLAGKTVMQELRKMVKEKVSAEELRRAKDYLSGKITLNLEDSSNRAEWYAKQQLFSGSALTPEERLRQYASVTPTQIQRVASKIFDPKQMGVAGIGPFKSPKDIWKHLV